MIRARAGRDWVRASSVWALAKATTLAGVNYRVTGLAGEAAFFALLSLPPFMLGLLGLMGHLSGTLGQGTVTQIRQWVIDQAEVLFTGNTVDSVVLPLLDDALRGGQASLISVGFLLSLWSGSRALFVYVDLISIAYGLGETRGIIRTRIMSFGLYLAALLIGLVVMPILVIGPTLLQRAVPEYSVVVSIFYWPVVIVGSVLMLTLLYHVSVPLRTRWWREVPGALIALIIWILCAAVLREVLAAWFEPLSIYGSLAAPIAVLLWLYITALAVLIGATLNAEVDRLWPLDGSTRSEAKRD
jgi:Predicted membrane protein